MTKPKEDSRDIFDKALDLADRNPAAIGALAVGSLGARGFRRIARKHGDRSIGPAIAGGVYGGVLGGAAGGIIGQVRDKKRKKRLKK